MGRARGVFGLQLLVALAGMTATFLMFALVAGSITLRGSDRQTLLEACEKFALPHVTVLNALVLAAGSVAFAVLTLGVRSALRQVRASRRFFSNLQLLRPLPLGPPGTMLFAGERPQAFCAGLLRPRIYVSEGTLGLLERAELYAVLAHEAHHARYRDPLRIFFTRTLSDALFFLPVLRHLSERYAALAELAADAAAVRRSGHDPAPLASALLAFDGAVSPAVVGIAPERIDHLLGERIRWELPVALLAWTLATVAAVLVVALRLADATAHTTVDLPLLASQLCMLAMAVVPLLFGAGTLIGSGRLFRRRLAAR